MLTEIGQVEAIYRYPVKSMRGERLEVADLGWYGLEGDRRLAFRRMQDRSGMPWLTASKLPDLLLFAPHRGEDGGQGDLPTHVRTPDGQEMPVFGEDLATEVGRRHGTPVEMRRRATGLFHRRHCGIPGRRPCRHPIGPPRSRRAADGGVADRVIRAREDYFSRTIVNEPGLAAGCTSHPAFSVTLQPSPCRVVPSRGPVTGTDSVDPSAARKTPPLALRRPH